MKIGRNIYFSILLFVFSLPFPLLAGSPVSSLELAETVELGGAPETMDLRESPEDFDQFVKELNRNDEERGRGKDEAPKKDDKVIYKYKDYEKFDMEELDVEGSNINEGDLSITPREQVKFQNKLPLKRNFNQEIRNSLESMK